jgi:hypothetical protein
MQSLFEAADCSAEVAQLDVNFCFFNVHFWNGLVVEKHFVELDQGRFQVFFFQRLFCLPKSFQNLLLSDPSELVFLKNCNQSLTSKIDLDATAAGRFSPENICSGDLISAEPLLLESLFIKV